MLSFDSYESGAALVLTVEDHGYGPGGDHHSANREWLYNTVATRETPLFALDLSSVSYLSSADFGILISLKRRVDARKGRLVLFQVSSFITDTLKTMRLLEFFQFAPDLRAALAILDAGI